MYAVFDASRLVITGAVAVIAAAIAYRNNTAIKENNEAAREAEVEREERRRMDVALAEAQRQVVDLENVNEALQAEIARLRAAQIDAATSVSVTSSSSEGTPPPAPRSRSRLFNLF